MRERRPDSPRPEELHAVAADATRGGGAPLPYADAIQRAFGRHSIGHVQAHSGAAAESGAEALGAEAFAFGDHVAFGGAPSLHTAAHEAAHVIQQRAGVQLLGGVGAAGDRYEEHADAVANLVVRGESAEALLDELAPTSAGSTGNAPAIQCKTIRNATEESTSKTNDELVAQRSTREEQRNTWTDRVDFSVSSTEVLATPEHDQSGWGFLVRADAADGLRHSLELCNYPGITWELRDTAPMLEGTSTVYKLLRPIASGTGGGLAMSPGDCYEKCLHTMNVVSAEAFFKDSNGHDVTCGVFEAKMNLMEEAFADKLKPEYWQHKREYLRLGEHYPERNELDRLMLEPYAALDPDAKDAFDRTHGINRYAAATPGQGFITMADYSSKTENFAFHAGGVLASEGGGGSDVITWENFANWAADYGTNDRERQAAQTDYAVFKMYSNDPASRQTFHDQIACGGNTTQGLQEARREYGNTPITFAIRPPSQPAIPVQPTPSYVAPTSPGLGFAPSSPGPDPSLDPYGLGSAFPPSPTYSTSAHHTASPSHDVSSYPTSSAHHDASVIDPRWLLDSSLFPDESGPTHDSASLDLDRELAFLLSSAPESTADTSFLDAILNYDALDGLPTTNAPMPSFPAMLPLPFTPPAAASSYREVEEHKNRELDDEEHESDDEEREGRKTTAKRARPTSDPRRRPASTDERKKTRTTATRTISPEQVRDESGRDASEGLVYWYQGERWKVVYLTTAGVMLEKLQ